MATLTLAIKGEYFDAIWGRQARGIPPDDAVLVQAPGRPHL